MLEIIKQKLYLFFVLIINLNGQYATSVDTICDFEHNKYIQLKNTFIIDPIIYIDGNKRSVISENVDVINGRVFLPDSLLKDTLILSYNYLLNKLPKKIGPKWMDLPELNKENNDNDDFKISSYNSGEKKTFLYPKGNFYRRLTFSPLGTSEFNGGMQIQLNGKLSNLINVSGIITDENIPFQPEGTTREIDDLDKVYIKISHPKFIINAGDIDFKNNSKHFNINRKLQGVVYHLKKQSLSGTSIYSGSKGEYKTLEIKGRDGDQGPYFLKGKNNSRDIIILSGTEKVWVDGKRMIRGENYDYTIDYSRGEVYFTPKILITFDTDILFEYQYSDFTYEQGFIGGYLKKNFGSLNSLSLGIYNEMDKFNEGDFDLSILDTLKNSPNSSIRISTAIKDINGDYIYDGNRFEYDPLSLLNEFERYNIVFYFDQNGDYKRQVSNEGKVYYQYVNELDRNNMLDLYSPFKIYSAPKSQQFGYVEYNYQINESIIFDGRFSGSKINNNKINNGTGFSGGSYNISSRVDSLDLKYFKFNLSLKDWNRSTDYASLNREEDIQFNRFWNLDTIISNGIRETTLNTDFIVDNVGTSKLEFSRLLYDQNEYSRLKYYQNFSSPKLRESFFNYLYVDDGRTMFYRSSGRLKIDYGKYSPLLSFLNENDNGVDKFNKIGIGVNYKRDNNNIETGIDYRKDEFVSQLNRFNNLQNDLLGYLNYTIESMHGFKSVLVYKKRIKKNTQKEIFNYSLFDLGASFKKNRNPLELDIQLKKEESFMEQRTVVYDSIGAGLGQYRYDSTFNTYIQDPNGSYISYNILTGDREPKTNFYGSQKFTIDFPKIFNRSNLLVRGFSRQEYQGTNNIIRSFYYNDIDDEGLSKLFMLSRLEAYYDDLRQITLWIEDQKLLDGYDPRGKDVRNIFKTGIDISQNINNSFLILYSLKTNNTAIESNVSVNRNRKMRGIWNDLRLNFKLNQFIDLDIGILGGMENGEQLGQKFFASSVGLRALGKIFFKKTGRFQSEILLVQTQEDNNAIILPPEALNGNPIGLSFRTNSKLQYFINRSFSILLSMNTIDNIRYNNFITMQGEFRAHF